MNKHSAKYIWLIVILAAGGIFAWRNFGRSGFSMSGSLPTELTAELGEAKVYESGENGGAVFSYPQKLKITEMPMEEVPDGKIILAESGEAKKGFEVVILPFDETAPLTKERILQDIPDKVIKNEKIIEMAGGIKALAFESEDENIGKTFEIWFSHNGRIYEARTYPEFGPSMGEILKTWKFK